MSGRRPDWEYTLGKDKLQESERGKDLKVVINNRHSPEEHVQEKVRNMHNLLGSMRVAFICIDKEMVNKIITSFIRPALEYAAVVWNPHLKNHTEY